jgi:TM2 domain-containing membrane protein YozV
VGETGVERKDCPGCGTPHHADCFAENGGCTVFGCSQAPADEAKVTVTATDMMGNVVTRQMTAPEAQPGASPGAGFTTLRAPAMAAPAQLAPTSVPPPPPLLSGTGVAPPPPLPRPLPQATAYAPAQLVDYYQAPQPKSRVVFVLLGIFLGIFGVHNFYAGYTKRGAIQLVATVLIAVYSEIAAWLWLGVWLWAIVEVCLVNKEADGAQFV